jgi:RNA polymerase primary sigma factor
MSVSPSAAPSKGREASGLRSSDSITWYLASIGREPLLTPSEEIELGNQVQKMMALIATKSDEYSALELKTIRVGRRAKDRMIKANLRLVVSIAKKYQSKGLELLNFTLSHCSECICNGVIGRHHDWLCRHHSTS